jgi:hypothetical protein
MNGEQQASFNGWARVEVMGHQTHIGYVRTEAYGQAVMFRVDVPSLPDREFVLQEPAYVGPPDAREWTRAGAKVQRLGTPGHSVLIGAGSIYRILPCSEAAALKAIESSVRSELKLIEPPPERMLTAGAELPEEEDDDELYDDDQDLEESA